ncbi:hypothetical protein O181_038892 [Austropuccinia psidii MF-1]|uniref:Major facilitator superfamily (MFS) profile domain-containing protein n=1 Tax=Austropuccinia psidii MF-1 TaxID=1389203 RepID=A0A9Q3DBT7_9BASI|nr:hypothetical protein [Austropuccinia psidii MF-1]
MKSNQDHHQNFMETASERDDVVSQKLLTFDPSLPGLKPKTISQLNYLYEIGDGDLLLDPLQARLQLGDELADQLKLDESTKLVLWPQPIDDPNDPQNWSKSKKLTILIILTMAAFIPDFDSGIGIASLFFLAKEFDSTPEIVNNLSSKYSINLAHLDHLFSSSYDLSDKCPATAGLSFYWDLVLFYSQVLGLGFLIGCTFATNLKVFTAMRCLNSFFSAAPQIMGLYCINGLFGYLVAKANWRWAYGIGCIYSAFVVILIAVFMQETLYDRLSPFQTPVCNGFGSRLKTLIGLTGFRTADSRSSWSDVISPTFELLYRPHCLAILVYLGVVFGFGIGINVTNVIFTTSPPPFGYGLSQYAVASLYATPALAVLIGELIGRYLNDKAILVLSQKNHGVFEPEFRLWSLYGAIVLFASGFIILGGSFEYKWNIAAVVFGWGLAEVGIMVTTVACYNYLNNSFFLPGEVSALLNQARTIGGFAVPYFQTKWATKQGALQTFGCEAGIAAGLFILLVPLIQAKGKKFRKAYGLKPRVRLPQLESETELHKKN